MTSDAPANMKQNVLTAIKLLKSFLKQAKHNSAIMKQKFISI
jgi:hypothetical protein